MNMTELKALISSDPHLRDQAQMLREYHRAGRRARTWGEIIDNYAMRVGLLKQMSFLTGTSMEVLYASIATGTALASFTTEDSLQKTLPPVMIPAAFFYNLAAAGKSLKIKAWGRFGAAATLPTYNWFIRLLTSTTWSAGGILLGQSNAPVTVASTLAPWTLEAEITCRSLGIGAGTTLACMGEVRSPKGMATPFGATIPDNNTAFTVTTVDNSVTYYLFLSASNTGGTSQASNLIQLEMLKVYGEN